jgi:multidrug efflux pump subunit AcrB
MITVRFKVNEPQEPSLAKIYQELAANRDLLPSGAMQPVVRLLTVDDVPFLGLTLHGAGQTPGQLRTMGDALARELSTVPATAQVKVIGGARRMVRIEPDPGKLRALGMSLGEIQPALQTAESQLPAGALVDHGRRTELEASGFVMEASEIERGWWWPSRTAARSTWKTSPVSPTAPSPSRPVVLSRPTRQAGFEPAVTMTLAKRPGTNATALANRCSPRSTRCAAD